MTQSVSPAVKERIEERATSLYENTMLSRRMAQVAARLEQDMTDHQIAEDTDLPVSQVRQWKTRLRERMRKSNQTVKEVDGSILRDGRKNPDSDGGE